jgi:hypothetical protein
LVGPGFTRGALPQGLAVCGGGRSAAKVGARVCYHEMRGFLSWGDTDAVADFGGMGARARGAHGLS